MLNQKKSHNKTIRLFLLLIFICVFFFSITPVECSKGYQQKNENIVQVELVTINSRSVTVNWTSLPLNDSNSFFISLESETFNQSKIWSVIFLNETIEEKQNILSPINYTINGELMQAQKSLSLNFTYYLIKEDYSSIQAKITGLKPSTKYNISLHSSYSTIKAGDIPIITITNSTVLWKSTIETSVSLIDELEYSQLSLILSLVTILIVFLLLFYYIAKKDLPYNRLAYLFILPAVLALILLEVYPIIYGIFLSFTSYGLKRGEIPVFVFFKNYAEVTKNPQLSIAFTTTIVWTVIVIFFKLLLGFIFAYSLHFKIKRKKPWYILLYLPWTIPAYIKILSWRSFFQGYSGDSFFNMLFQTNINLLVKPYTALFIASFVEISIAIPFITTLFLGALSSIPKELIDISEVDQISEWLRIKKIVFPLIKPIILPAIVLEIIKSFGSFNVAFLLTGGYPILKYGVSDIGVIGATDLFSTFTFYMFYQQRAIGIAAAYSTIMSIITLFFVLIWIKISKGMENKFQPEDKKTGQNNLFTIIVIVLLQSIGYIISAYTGFRYFGFYYSKITTLFFAGFYLLVFISLITRKGRIMRFFRSILIVDLFISFFQLVRYQMWYAFNWNILIIAIVLLLLAQIDYSGQRLTRLSFVFETISNRVNQLIKLIKVLLRRVDNAIVRADRYTVIISLEAVFLLIYVLMIHSTLYMLISFVLILLSLIGYTFLNCDLKLDYMVQLLVFLLLIFSHLGYGWIALLTFFLTTFFLNKLQLYLLSNGIERNNLISQSICSMDINASAMFFLVVFVSLIPFWNILWIAFAPLNQLVPTSFIPDNPTLENFKHIFTQEQIHVHFLNSLIVSLGSATICLIVTTLAGYAISRYSFNLKDKVMLGVFILKMFTGVLTLIPFYLIMYNLGLIDRFIGVILAYSVNSIPILLWIVKGYFDSIPTEIDESALIMGNSRFRILRKIIFPLSKPVLAIAFLLNFLSAWNGFLLAFVLIQSASKYTLPIKLYSLLGSIETSSPEWGLFASASVLVIIPMLVLFILLRDYIMGGTKQKIDVKIEEIAK